jgi:hypothetical protein
MVGDFLLESLLTDASLESLEGDKPFGSMDSPLDGELAPGVTVFAWLERESSELS